MKATTVEELRKRAVEFRALLEPGLDGFERGAVDSSGGCLYASIMCAALLQRFKMASCKVCGGDGNGDGGFMDPQGNMRGHYWIEAIVQGEIVVLDITADQFGLEPVVVKMKSDADNRHFAGDQLLVNEHVASLAKDLSMVVRQDDF